MPRRQSQSCRGIAGQTAQDLGRRHDLRQQAARQVRRRQQFVGVVPAQQIVHAAAGGIRIVGRQPAGQPVVHVVLGAEHLVDAAEHLRLAVAVPEDLEQRVVRRWKTIAGQPIPVCRIDLLEESGRLLGRPLVRPDRRRVPQQPPPGVQRDTAQTVSRDGDAADTPRIDGSVGQQLSRAADHRFPPSLRPLFMPARLRVLRVVGDKCGGDQAAVRVVQRRLVAAGSQIVSEKRVSHG